MRSSASSPYGSVGRFLTACGNATSSPYGSVGGLLIAVSLSSSASALTPFVEQLRKAEARDASDPERVEFATRALRAWRPSDGRPLMAHAHFLRAEGEIALFDDAAAEDDLTKTLEIDARNERARLLRARARAALGRGAEAERDAAEYAAANPDDAEGWLALGEARLASGSSKANKSTHAAFAKAATLLDGEDPRPSLGSGRAYLAARRYQEALTALSAAAASPKKHRAEILTWRARAYASLGNWPAAREDLSSALPDLEHLLNDRRRARAAQRGLDSAQRALADAYLRRGLAHEALKIRTTALSDYRQACELGLPPACARADSLDKPEPKAATVRPKAKKTPHRKNPKGDSGDRIYAN